MGLTGNFPGGLPVDDDFLGSFPGSLTGSLADKSITELAGGVNWTVAEFVFGPPLLILVSEIFRVALSCATLFVSSIE